MVREIISKMLPIDAGAIHVQITEGGSIPVVFAAGAGCWSDHWLPVLERLSPRFVGIAYDRPGLGLSEPSAYPRTIRQMSLELESVLETLEIQGAILVGHSFSASVLRMFEQMYPEKVLAILYVDGWHDSFADWDKAQSHQPSKASERIFFTLGRFGFFKLMSKVVGQARPEWCRSEDRWRRISRASVSPRFFRTMQREMAAYEENSTLIDPHREIKVPVSCLVCKDTLDPQEVSRGYPREAHNSEWLASSSRLAESSARSKVTVLPDLNHMFLLSEPNIIVDEIDYLGEQLTEAGAQ